MLLVRDLVRELQKQDPRARVRTPDNKPVYVVAAKSGSTVYITDEEPKKPTSMITVVARLLDYSFSDIDFSWDGLTKREQAIIETPEMLARVSTFIRKFSKQ